MQRKRWLGAVLLAGSCGGLLWWLARPYPPAHIESDPVGMERHVIAIQREPLSVADQLKGKTGVIEMVMTDTAVRPAEIKVKGGEQVRIHLKNAGSKPHNLVVPQFHILAGTISPGGENYIEFTAGTQGTWAFFSDPAGTGQEPGLAGQLKVE